MKRILVFLMAAVLFTAASVNAQDKTNYIIVKTSGGEVASFAPGALERQYIEGSNWVFLLKNSAKYTYPLATVLPFTMEVRSSNTGTGNQSIVPETGWYVYDNGHGLLIENPGGVVGQYEVFNLTGQLLKSGYEAGSKAVVAVPSGGLYVVKAGVQAKKAVKK